MHSPNEYEFVNYSKLKHFQIGFVEILYRNLHIHKEFEIGMILKGSARFLYGSQQFQAYPGDIFIFNPNEAHEITSSDSESVRIAYIHLSRYFCNEYLQLLRHIIFDEHIIRTTESAASIRNIFLQTFTHYIAGDSLNMLRCMGDFFQFLNLILEMLPYHNLSSDDYGYDKKKSLRIERILEIIDSHYNEKLSLTALAQSEGISPSYLSYFIHKNTGMTFQALLTNARLEKAAKLLIQSNMRAIDICLESGFSDLKYMNQAFQKHFNCSPSEFRERRNYLDEFSRERSSNQTYVSEAQGTRWIRDFMLAMEQFNRS